MPWRYAYKHHMESCIVLHNNIAKCFCFTALFSRGQHWQRTKTAWTDLWDLCKHNQKTGKCNVFFSSWLLCFKWHPIKTNDTTKQHKTTTHRGNQPLPTCFDFLDAFQSFRCPIEIGHFKIIVEITKFSGWYYIQSRPNKLHVFFSHKWTCKNIKNSIQILRVLHDGYHWIIVFHWTNQKPTILADWNLQCLMFLLFLQKGSKQQTKTPEQ